MVDVVKTVVLPAPGGAATGYVQRFTFPDCGEVKGFLICQVSSDDDTTQLFGLGQGIGFSDGTSEVAYGGTIELNTELSWDRLVNDRCLVGLDFDDGSVNLEATTDGIGLVSGTNDGYVDIEWLTPPSSESDTRSIAVRAYCGTGVQTKVLDNVQTDGTNGNSVTATFSFYPTLGFLLTNNNSAMDSGGEVLPSSDGSATKSGLSFEFGWWGNSSETTPDQHGVCWTHGNGTTNVACMASSYAGRYIATSGSSTYFEGEACQIVNRTSTSVDVKTVHGSGGGSSTVVALFGVHLPNSRARSVLLNTSTSAAQQDIAQEFRDQTAMVLPTRCETINVGKADFNAGPCGLSFVDRDMAISYSWGFRDASGSSNTWCRVSRDKFVMLPLHDGTLGTGHFDVDFLGFGGFPDFDLSVDYNSTDTTQKIWPVLLVEHDNPAEFSPGPATVSLSTPDANFGGSSIEYFELGSAATLFNEITGGGGTLTVDPEEGLGSIDTSAGPGASAYWVDKIKVRKDRTWAVQLTARLDSGTGHPDLLSIINQTATPVSPYSPLLSATAKRIQFGFIDDGTPSARAGYFLTGADPGSYDYGNGRFWNGSTETWGASGVAQDWVSVRTAADFYTFTIFNDGENQRFCLLIQNSAEATTIRDDRQGEIGRRTDWVNWADFGVPTDDLWVIVGDRYFDDYSSVYSVHKYEKDLGGESPLRSLCNCKDSLTENYVIREVIGADKVWILAERNQVFFSDSQTYGNGGIRKRSWIKDDDGKEYLFYEAFEIGGAFGPRGSGGTGETRIKVVSRNSSTDSWSSPTTLLAPSDISASYQVLTGIQVIKWNQHPTPSEKCMMFLTAEVAVSTKSEHRMFVLTASELDDTTWTVKPGSGTDGAIFEGVASDTEFNHSGHGDPRVELVGSTWHMMLSSLHSPASPSGVNPVQGWQICHATSSDSGTPVNWTLDGSAPVIPNDVDGIRTAVAPTDGTFVTISDGVHDKHQVVLCRRSNTPADDWAMIRVRKKESTGIDPLQQIVGLTPLTGNTSIAVIGTGSITPHATRFLSNGDIELRGTAFQPFIRGDGNGDGVPEGLGNCEITARWTSSDWSTWTIDYDHSPVVILTDKAGRNLENFSDLQLTIGDPPEISFDNPLSVPLSRSIVSTTIGLVPQVAVEDEVDVGWTYSGVRYINAETQSTTMGFLTSIEVLTNENSPLLEADQSGTEAVTLTLALAPELDPLDFDQVLTVDESASTVVLSSSLGLVPLPDPDSLPLLRVSRSSSTVGSPFMLELEGDLNLKILESGSCVGMSLELNPTCGRIEDFCQPICKLDIWNSALVLLGLPMQSDENASNKYIARLRLGWTRVRKEFLREGAFNGSSDRRVLTQIDGGADHRSDYAYAYDLPSCFIKAIMINGVEARSAGELYTIALSYDRSKRVLYSNEDSVELDYIRDIEDVNQLDSSAQTALIHLLALDIGPAFKDPEELEPVKKWYTQHVLEARSTDTAEVSPENFEDYTDALWWNS